MTATDRAAALELAREYLDDLHPQFVNGETAVLARALIAAEAELDEAIRLAREATGSGTYRSSHHDAFKAVTRIASMRKSAGHE